MGLMLQQSHQHGDTTPATVALGKQQNNTTQWNDYWQRNNDNGGELHFAGTLAGMLILARKQGIHGKQAIKSDMTCKLA